MNSRFRSDAKNLVIGIDEVGRGSWSGPVVACAVLLKPEILNFSLSSKINDSKKVDKINRKKLSEFIKNYSFYSFGESSAKEIDETNILEATIQAIKRAFRPFKKLKNKVCIDLGASSGGFTDVLITRGAEHVYAADVGKSQLSWKLVSSDKVTILDKTNVRYLKLNEIDRD